MPTIEAVLTQTYLDREVFNVFHYYGTASLTTTVAQLEEFGLGFRLSVVPALNAIQVAGVENVSLKITELANTNIQTQQVVAGVGDMSPLNGSFWLPRAMTYAYRLYVGQSYNLVTATLYTGTRRITHGYKRFAGVSEEFISSGNWDTAGTDIDTLSDALSAVLNDPIPTTVDGTQSWVPMVMGRAIEATEDLPARVALRAFITSAVLQPPAWTNRRR